MCCNCFSKVVAHLCTIQSVRVSFSCELEPSYAPFRAKDTQYSDGTITGITVHA